ncbi:hypothetical protein HRbin27_00224 [bacterium HR27]|nr:hypothetical protein HRbin27_00224 [bacterium HR27]
MIDDHGQVRKPFGQPRDVGEMLDPHQQVERQAPLGYRRDPPHDLRAHQPVGIRLVLGRRSHTTERGMAGQPVEPLADIRCCQVDPADDGHDPGIPVTQREPPLVVPVRASGLDDDDAIHADRAPLWIKVLGSETPAQRFQLLGQIGRHPVEIRALDIPEVDVRIGDRHRSDRHRRLLVLTPAAAIDRSAGRTGAAERSRPRPTARWGSARSPAEPSPPHAPAGSSRRSSR